MRRVLYIENKMFKGEKKCHQIALFGLWDGNMVQFDDEEKTIVRNKKYLIFL